MEESESLAGTLEELHRRGFTASFAPAAGGLRASERDRTYRPEELAIVEHHRFEGISDPDDMAVIYAIEAADGTRGVLVDAFGAYADPAVGAVLPKIDDRADGHRPAA